MTEATGAIASLGMYEFAETRAALDALWAAIAARLRSAGIAGVPAGLTRHRALADIWRDRHLLLAQTCGYPFLAELTGHARIVATPTYDVPGCDGAWHRSFIIVRADAPYRTLADLRGARAAVNGYDSNSGMNLFRAALAPIARGQPMFTSVAVTGAHAVSFAAVARGEADVAAIDCVSYWFITRESPELATRIRVLAETPPSPGLPLITRKETPDAAVDIMREALDAAVASPALSERMAALRLTGFARLGAADYAIILDYENAAVAAGYPRLA